MKCPACEKEWGKGDLSRGWCGGCGRAILAELPDRTFTVMREGLTPCGVALGRSGAMPGTLHAPLDPTPAKTWLVRTRCDYTLEVDADTPEEALKKAHRVPVDNWHQAWLPDTATLKGEPADGR